MNNQLLKGEQYRYKLVTEYLGTGFCGWQRQLNAVSVQEVLEDAIYKFSGERTTIFAAGRTDKGVHAIGQVAHFDLYNKHYPACQIQRAINYFAKPHKVVVIDCAAVDSSFHARFSATSRHYLYNIINRPTQIILEENKAWWVKEPLNIDQMVIAANYLIGTHDFTSFRAKHCQASSPIKTLLELRIIQNQDKIYFNLSADAFLYHMVRNIVGTLKLIGTGKLDPSVIQLILAAKDRTKAGPTAPACGLYFLRADY